VTHPTLCAFGALSILLALGSQSAAQDAAPKPAAAKPAAGSRPEVKAERKRPTDGDALRKAAFAPARVRARRQALLKLLPKGAVAVVVNTSQKSEIFPFRPSPSFFYLSGQEGAGLTLLVSGDEDVLFAPPKDRRWERWNGSRLSVGSLRARSAGFRSVVPLHSRAKRILAALKTHGGPLYLAGCKLADLGLKGEVKARSLYSALARLRQVKDPAELALMRRAIGITTSALHEAMASLRAGQYEYEVQAVIEYLFTRYGAKRPAFTSIVGSGPNSCVLHYNASRRRIGPGELVVLDVGAEFHGYAADVTRTIPSSGRYSKRQRQIYEIVLAAQRAGIAAIKPGATLREVHRAARGVIVKAGYGKYFLHSTSHWLGLDVHDVGLRVGFKPGMVLTVEPGIYLPAEGIGVRIEDDVLVTREGHEVLSAAVPREPDAIEALMRRRGVGKRAVTPLPKPKAPKATPATPKSPRRHFFLR